MSELEFVKKYKRVFNIYSLEMHCRLTRNKIAHSIGNEKRLMESSSHDAVERFLVKMAADINQVPSVKANQKQLKLKLK